MGQEALCTVTHRDQSCSGKAHLDSDRLVFRSQGPERVRLSIPFAELTRVEAADGCLRVAWAGETVELHLGAQAEKWAERIRNPRTRIDKLGVRPDSRVCLLGVTDAMLPAELAGRGADVVDGEPRGDEDFLFLQADRPEELARLGPLQALIKRNGAIWVVSPRGVPGLKDTEVMAAAHGVGLVDVKVVAFSATHSANKFVIPVARR